MTTPYDCIPVEVRRANRGWFGPAWPSGICYAEDGRLIEEMRKPFPSGEECLFCDQPFDEAAGDSGQAISGPEGVRHAHKECALVQVIGPLAHHERRCHCYGGDDGTPGMTVRQEAVEVWRRLQAGTLYGRHG